MMGSYGEQLLGEKCARVASINEQVMLNHFGDFNIASKSIDELCAAFGIDDEDDDYPTVDVSDEEVEKYYAVEGATFASVVEEIENAMAGMMKHDVDPYPAYSTKNLETLATAPVIGGDAQVEKGFKDWYAAPSTHASFESEEVFTGKRWICTVNYRGNPIYKYDANQKGNAKIAIFKQIYLECEYFRKEPGDWTKSDREAYQALVGDSVFDYMVFKTITSLRLKIKRENMSIFLAFMHSAEVHALIVSYFSDNPRQLSDHSVSTTLETTIMTNKCFRRWVFNFVIVIANIVVKHPHLIAAHHFSSLFVEVKRGLDVMANKEEG